MSGVATVRTLGLVELRRFMRHPLVVVGAMGVALTADVITGNDEWRAALLGFGLLPAFVLWFAVVHLAVSRDRRAGVEELVGSFPIRPEVRTFANLVWPVAVAVSVAVVWLGFALLVVGADRTIAVNTYTFSDITWTATAPELAQPLLVVTMVLLLAVAVGVWWQHPVAAFLVPLVLFMSPLMWVVPPIVEGGLVERAGGLVEVASSSVAWHLVYLAGWIAVFAATALLRHERRPVLGAAVAAGLVAVVAGFSLGPLPLS